MPTEIMVHSLAAGILASVACGLGVLPLLWPRIDAQRHTGIGYSFSGGMMFAASVYNLIFPGLVGSNDILSLSQVAPVLAGMLLGAGFLSVSDRFLSHDHSPKRPWQRLGNRATVLIFLAMTIHSIPEGVAVGVGFTRRPGPRQQPGH